MRCDRFRGIGFHYRFDYEFDRLPLSWINKNNKTRMKDFSIEASNKKEKRPKKKYHCACCDGEFPFCWTCRCGFQICQACMLENFWGMSCNAITWQCPDCGQWNGFGNQ
jgi:hypothetical protein